MTRNLQTTVALSVALALPACADTERTPVRPLIDLYLQDAAPKVAYVTGTSIDIHVAWAAWCTTHGFGDTSTTELCDEQDFTARVTCSGAPCDLDPPAASAGIELTGDAVINVSAPVPGNLTIEVVIEHASTHEQLSRRGQIAIRDHERLVVDCVYQAYDAATPRCVQGDGYVSCRDVPWAACPARATLDPVWGTPVSIWVYGEGGGLPLSTTTTIPSEGNPLHPDVQFSGFELPRTDYTTSYAHSTDDAAAVAIKYEDDLKTVGTLLTTARQNGLVTQAVTEFVAP